MFYEQNICKICKSNENETIYKLPFKNHKFKDFFNDFYGKENSEEIFNLTKNYDYEILNCKKCKFKWQKFIPDNIFLNKLYNNWISFEKSLQKKNSINEDIFFSSLLNILKKDQINTLDYGAGVGNFCNFSKKRGFNSFAIEYSTERIEYLKSKKINVINFSEIDNYNIKFDLIYINQVLEHLENFNEFFINLNSLSKKNSIIYISVPNAEKIKNPVKKGPFQPLEHLNTFNNSNLKELMKKNNYTPISTNRILRSMISNKNTINFFFKRIFNQMFTTNILFEKN